MIRVLGILAVLLAVAAAVALYSFKEGAATQTAKIQTLRQQIAAERQTINVLRAEWNYLNQPNRIQELAERYLDLDRLEISQITTIRSLPMRPLNLDPETSSIGGFAGGEGRIVQ